MAILCDVEGIDRVAKQCGLKAIYDAAHTFAVRYKGRSSACFGNMSMFSFHAAKMFYTIEGGAVCYSDDRPVQPLDAQKNFGMCGPEVVTYVGGDAKNERVPGRYGHL